MDGYIFIWTIKNRKMNSIMNKNKTIVSVTRKREDKWLESSLQVSKKFGDFLLQFRSVLQAQKLGFICTNSC